SMLDLFSNSGFLFSYCVGPYTSYMLFSSLCCIFPALFLITVLFMPETPIHLLKKNNRESALQSLARLRNESKEEIK
ncbi:hypothetical protein L9F63_013210, partial [Diploptera punctata]